MAKTGCKIDDFIDYSNAISCIYGKPATGKTTLCLMAAAREKGKVVFIETESGFSADRMEQIAGNINDNFVLIPVRSFEEQCRAVESLLELKGKISLVIIDSFTALYRQELQNKKDANPLLSRQLSILKEISATAPVLITSQVYMTMDKKDVGPVGSNMLKSWCNNLVKLHDDGKNRLLFIEKSTKGSHADICFEITNEGIKTK
ncbi:MAG: AAA family ATPase [Nanoarchaeota archaeon]|nr:AAA family ATPase [Nanoarchaeota archaeon]